MSHRARLFAASACLLFAFAWFASVVRVHAPDLAMQLVVGGRR